MFGLRSADGIPFPFHCCWKGQSQNPPYQDCLLKTSQCDPQHCLSRQHNELSVHPETHRALDTKNNFSLFLQSKITGPRLAQAHHKHSGSPQQAVNYWLLAGKLGNFKDDKIPGVYNM